MEKKVKVTLKEVNRTEYAWEWQNIGPSFFTGDTSGEEYWATYDPEETGWEMPSLTRDARGIWKVAMNKIGELDDKDFYQEGEDHAVPGE